MTVFVATTAVAAVVIASVGVASVMLKLTRVVHKSVVDFAQAMAPRQIA